MTKSRKNAVSLLPLSSFVRSTFLSSVAFAHDEVQTTEHCRHIAHHATGQKLWQDAEVHERWRPNFQPIWNAASSTVNVKTKLALGIFRREVNLARRRVESFRDHNEMMN